MGCKSFKYVQLNVIVIFKNSLPLHPTGLLCERCPPSSDSSGRPGFWVNKE
jgi:hypothetical protein